jgi:hypothetical protein
LGCRLRGMLTPAAGDRCGAAELTTRRGAGGGVR